MNRPEFLAIACNLLKAGKNRAHKMRMVLVLLLIGWKLARDFKPIIEQSNRNRPFPFFPLASFHVKISFHLHVNENWFSYERISTRARFEKEAKGNSEMAYCVITFDSHQGPVSRKSRKAILETPTRLFCKAGLFICCKESKNQNKCKVPCLETPSFWRYKENYVTRNEPEKFQDFRETGPRPQLFEGRIALSIG